jgi:hypothetical protein
MLDVLPFVILKSVRKYERGDDTLPVVLDHILRLFRAYETTTPSTPIRAPWNKTGLDYERQGGAIDLAINESAIRQSPEFREIWAFDY